MSFSNRVERIPTLDRRADELRHGFDELLLMYSKHQIDGRNRCKLLRNVHMRRSERLE